MLSFNYLSSSDKCPSGLEGVYAIITQSEEHIYVGQSRDVRQRLITHLRQSGGAHRLYQYMNEHTRDLTLWTVKIYDVTDCELRTYATGHNAVLAMEALLINSLAPSANNTPGYGTQGTGKHTHTLKIDGQLYQQRLITCGKEKCNRCKEDGGHLAVYMDTGAKGGARWQYIGARLPEAEADYVQPTCQHEGCTNPVSRRNQRYCSAKCRVAAHRAKV